MFSASQKKDRRKLVESSPRSKSEVGGPTLNVKKQLKKAMSTGNKQQEQINEESYELVAMAAEEAMATEESVEMLEIGVSSCPEMELVDESIELLEKIEEDDSGLKLGAAGSQTGQEVESNAGTVFESPQPRIEEWQIRPNSALKSGKKLKKKDLLPPTLDPNGLWSLSKKTTVPPLFKKAMDQSAESDRSGTESDYYQDFETPQKRSGWNPAAEDETGGMGSPSGATPALERMASLQTPVKRGAAELVSTLSGRLVTPETGSNVKMPPGWLGSIRPVGRPLICDDEGFAEPTFWDWGPIQFREGDEDNFSCGELSDVPGEEALKQEEDDRYIVKYEKHRMLFAEPDKQELLNFVDCQNAWLAKRKEKRHEAVLAVTRLVTRSALRESARRAGQDDGTGPLIDGRLPADEGDFVTRMESRVSVSPAATHLNTPRVSAIRLEGPPQSSLATRWKVRASTPPPMGNVDTLPSLEMDSCVICPLRDSELYLWFAIGNSPEERVVADLKVKQTNEILTKMKLTIPTDDVDAKIDFVSKSIRSMSAFDVELWLDGGMIECLQNTAQPRLCKVAMMMEASSLASGMDLSEWTIGLDMDVFRTRSYLTRLGNWLYVELVASNVQTCVRWREQAIAVCDELEDFIQSHHVTLDWDLKTDMTSVARWTTPDPVTGLYPIAFYKLDSANHRKTQVMRRISLQHADGETLKSKLVPWEILEKMTNMAPIVILAHREGATPLTLGRSRPIGGALDLISEEIIRRAEQPGRCQIISRTVQDRNAKRVIAMAEEASHLKPNFMIVAGIHNDAYDNGRMTAPFRIDLNTFCQRVGVEIEPDRRVPLEKDIQVSGFDRHMKLIAARIQYDGPPREVSAEVHRPQYLGHRGYRRPAGAGEIFERDRMGQTSKMTSSELVISLLSLPSGTRNMASWRTAAVVRGLSKDAGMAGMVIKILKGVVGPSKSSFTIFYPALVYQDVTIEKNQKRKSIRDLEQIIIVATLDMVLQGKDTHARASEIRSLLGMGPMFDAQEVFHEGIALVLHADLKSCNTRLPLEHLMSAKVAYLLLGRQARDENTAMTAGEVVESLKETLLMDEIRGIYRSERLDQHVWVLLIDRGRTYDPLPEHVRLAILELRIPGKKIKAFEYVRTEHLPPGLDERDPQFVIPERGGKPIRMDVMERPPSPIDPSIAKLMGNSKKPRSDYLKELARSGSADTDSTIEDEEPGMGGISLDTDESSTHESRRSRQRVGTPTRAAPPLNFRQAILNFPTGSSQSSSSDPPRRVSQPIPKPPFNTKNTSSREGDPDHG